MITRGNADVDDVTLKKVVRVKLWYEGCSRRTLQWLWAYYRFHSLWKCYRGVIRVWWHRTSHICCYQKSFLNAVSSLHESLTPIVLAALRQTEWDQVSRVLNNCTTRRREAAGSVTCRDRFSQNKASQRRWGKQIDVWLIHSIICVKDKVANRNRWGG